MPRVTIDHTSYEVHPIVYQHIHNLRLVLDDIIEWYDSGQHNDTNAPICIAKELRR